ncbi:hypothetical protein [Asticcacaulis sp. YBE204]|uniref:hypothetical protein n=1 Tax=Asticcacaulis sp. YBE204 TaxID=1282363 RepID=UPI0003C3C9FE|nr:hypothetical protein [Asticcacaulis sp. YBE204]ESQ78137.1 hypothetical protein AEYBE204_14940 [Asticcacaulis sp. YBE204]
MNADGSAGEVSSATDSYRWANRFFLFHDVDAVMNGQRLRSLEIISLGGDGVYATRSYDADGSVNDFTAQLDGCRWTISGAVQRFDGRFGNDGQTLSGLWDMRDDEIWKPLMRVEQKRPRSET